jgi:hypothetical protein
VVVVEAEVVGVVEVVAVVGVEAEVVVCLIVKYVEVDDEKRAKAKEHVVEFLEIVFPFSF